MLGGRPLVSLTALCLLAVVSTAAAQDQRRSFVGLVFGVSALSPDSRAVTAPTETSVSLYTPKNGPAINVFYGRHLARFVTLQANYVWNTNDLTLVSSVATAAGAHAYEQRRASTQHAAVADFLLYFRNLDSGIRPYLGTGLALVHFASTETSTTSSGLAAPRSTLSSTRMALRSHVGIDAALSPRIIFRYSFSETIGANPVSPHLTPRGQRGMANFQNLFGLVARF